VTPAGLPWEFARWLGGVLIYLRTMALFLLAWYFAAEAVPNKLLLPSPLAVAQALRESWLDGELTANAGISLLRLFVSVAAAAVLAIPIGLAMGRSRTISDLLEWPVTRRSFRSCSARRPERNPSTGA